MLALGMVIINFIWVTIPFGVVDVPHFLTSWIKKFNYATPGRNGNYETADGSDEASHQSQLAVKLLKHLKQ